MGSDEIIRPSEETAENVVPRSWWRSLLGRRRPRQPGLMRRGDEQQLAWRVQDIIVELGLTQTTYSVSGGHTRHVPEVISVTSGPPHRMDVRILRSQAPEDFAAYAPAIARKLGVAEVRVLWLGDSVIRLEFESELRQQAEESRKLNEKSAALRAKPGQDPSTVDLNDKSAVVDPSESPNLLSTVNTGSGPISTSTSDVSSASSQKNRADEGGHPRSSVEREQAPGKYDLVPLSITIYVSDESTHEQVEAAVEHLLTAAGAHIEHRDDPVHGSWFRRMRAKIRMLVDSPVGNEAKNLTLHAAEVRLVHAQDATVTATFFATSWFGPCGCPNNERSRDQNWCSADRQD